MKLIEITLRNFQRHPLLTVPVSDKITAVVGNSDTGKTSLMRGIDWLLNNRPVGFSYRHNPQIINPKSKPLKDKDITSVRFTFDDGSYVERARDNNKINHYSLNGTIFSALKGEVPKEVSDFLNISGISVQKQHDSHFLISDSAGEVAKKLNNLVGLEEIDQVTFNINRIVDDYKKDSKRVETELEANREEYKTYDFIVPADKLIRSIDVQIEKSQDIAQNIGEIEKLCDILQSSQEELEGIELWLEVEKPYGDLMRKVEHIRDVLKKHDELTLMVGDLGRHQKTLSSMQWIDAVESKLKDLSIKTTQHKTLKIDFDEITYINEQFRVYTRGVEDSEAIIERAQETYQSMLEKLGICPTCGQEIGTGNENHRRQCDNVQR